MKSLREPIVEGKSGESDFGNDVDRNYVEEGLPENYLEEEMISENDNNVSVKNKSDESNSSTVKEDFGRYELDYFQIIRSFDNIYLKIKENQNKKPKHKSEINPSNLTYQEEPLPM